jgi:hypothetical protein
MAIELIHGKDVERLKDEELRSVLNALLDADASLCSSVAEALNDF